MRSVMGFNHKGAKTINTAVRDESEQNKESNITDLWPEYCSDEASGEASGMET